MNFFRNSNVFKMMFYKRNEYEKYDKDRFYGAYIHRLRKYYEVAQKDLARSIHVSNSTLSKMESGQQNMDPDTFDRAIKYFEKYDSDYFFNREISKLEEAEQWIDLCSLEFISLSYEGKVNEIKTYLDQEENKHSPAYFLYKVIKVFYDLFNGKGTMKDVESLVATQYFQNNRTLAILYDLWGIIEDSTNPDIIEKQIEILYKALTYAQRANDMGLIGLIEYHLIYRYDDLSQPDRALDLIESCKSHFQKAGAYRRILEIQLAEGVIYKKLRMYSKAMFIYDRLSSNKNQILGNKIKTSLYTNYSWCLFMQEKDEQALEYALIALSLESTFPDLYIVLAFSNYRLKNFELSRHYALEFLEKDLEDERSLFIKLFMELLIRILDKEEEIQDLIEQIMDQLPSFKAIELEIPFYSLLVDHFKAQKNFEAALKYEDLLVHYLKFDYNFH